MTSNYIPKNYLIGNVTIKIIFLGFKENHCFMDINILMANHLIHGICKKMLSSSNVQRQNVKKMRIPRILRKPQ